MPNSSERYGLPHVLCVRCAKLAHQTACTMAEASHMLCCSQIGLFNHSSWVDAVLIMFLFAPSGVSKESNAHLPLIGICIRSFQNIYVSRGSIEGEKRKAGIESVSDKIAKRCAWDLPFVLICAQTTSAEFP